MRCLSIAVMIIIFSILLLLPITADRTDQNILYEDHDPEFPEEGEEVRITIVTDINTSREGYSLNILHNGTIYSMIFDEGNISSSSKIYFCIIVFSSSGKNELEARLERNGSIVSNFHFNITVKEQNEKKENDNILGLPKWYCSISILIITIFIIFLTWSYFKGRRLQRSQREIFQNGIKECICSECGKIISPDHNRCPHCLARLNSNEYVCGKCEGSILADDVKCPHCHANLSIIKSPHSEDNNPTEKYDDPDIKKLKNGPAFDGKFICNNCGMVLTRNEKICIYCNEEQTNEEE